MNLRAAALLSAACLALAACGRPAEPAPAAPLMETARIPGNASAEAVASPVPRPVDATGGLGLPSQAELDAVKSGSAAPAAAPLKPSGPSEEAARSSVAASEARTRAMTAARPAPTGARELPATPVPPAPAPTATGSGSSGTSR